MHVITENWLLHSSMHGWLVAASDNVPRVAVLRANYLEAYQMSLDLNQSGETLAHWRERRVETALALSKEI